MSLRVVLYAEGGNETVGAPGLPPAPGAPLLEDDLGPGLSWPLAHRRPDLAVVLVDGDEDAGRRARLHEMVSDLPVAKVVGVAVQEFEAWLLADHAAVRQALGGAQALPNDPEGMARREAKALLVALVDARSERDMRLTLASLCDIDVVRRRCPAFDQFVRDLATHGWMDPGGAMYVADQNGAIYRLSY